MAGFGGCSPTCASTAQRIVELYVRVRVRAARARRRACWPPLNVTPRSPTSVASPPAGMHAAIARRAAASALDARATTAARGRPSAASRGSPAAASGTLRWSGTRPARRAMRRAADAPRGRGASYLAPGPTSRGDLPPPSAPREPLRPCAGQDAAPRRSRSVRLFSATSALLASSVSTWRPSPQRNACRDAHLAMTRRHESDPYGASLDARLVAMKRAPLDYAFRPPQLAIKTKRGSRVPSMPPRAAEASMGLPSRGHGENGTPVGEGVNQRGRGCTVAHRFLRARRAPSLSDP